MLIMSRRGLLASAAVAAAFGLHDKRLAFVDTAYAQAPLEPTKGFYKYKVGSIEVTAVYDGIWRKPHDPTFIKNASVEETKAALAKAGLTTEFMPIPLTVIVLKIGDKHIMVDAGSGVGQWQANATHLPANMKAAGIDRSQISTILVSHFHPDHVWGLMEKGTNAAVFPNAELIVNSTEYNWWTEPGRVEKLAEGRRAAGKRIADVFPTWKNWKLVEDNAEVAPGVRILAAPGHTPGHSAFLVTSGKDQLMVSNDAMYVPALLAPHPEWQGAYDQDGAMAVATRRKLDRPRHRRQDDDLRRAFPVPRRRHVRQGRQRLRLHAGRPILITPWSSIIMKTKPASILAGLTLVVGLGLAPALLSAPAYAVDNMSSTDAPDLTSVRAKIKAKDYAAALAELQRPRRGCPAGRRLQFARLHAAQDRRLQDVADLLHQGAGAAAGPQGRPRISRRALCRNRQYGKGQGTARRAGKTLPGGCEEREDLQKAISAKSASN